MNYLSTLLWLKVRPEDRSHSHSDSYSHSHSHSHRYMLIIKTGMIWAFQSDRIERCQACIRDPIIQSFLCLKVLRSDQTENPANPIRKTLLPGSHGGKVGGPSPPRKVVMICYLVRMEEYSWLRDCQVAQLPTVAWKVKRIWSGELPKNHGSCTYKTIMYSQSRTRVMICFQKECVGDSALLGNMQPARLQH